jgi:hypothetical protein
VRLTHYDITEILTSSRWAHTEIVDSDKENDADNVKPKQKHGHNQLAEIVNQRNTTDAKWLEKARKLDEQRHAEMQQLQQCSIDLQENLLVGLGKLADRINILVQSQAKLAAAEANCMEIDNHHRYEESEHRREDTE